MNPKSSIDLPSLEDLAHGNLVQRFRHHLEAVVANLTDPNTDLKPREITLKVKLTPNQARTSAQVLVSSSAKLSPDMPTDTTLFLNRIRLDGETCVVATEYSSVQESPEVITEGCKDPATRT